MLKEIYITESDKLRLKNIIETEIKRGNALDKSMKKLDEEVNSAKVVNSQQIPRDVITMNSRALLNLDDEEIEISLVYPEDADLSENKMSVLSPIGMAILGYKAGDTVEWEVPSGVAQIQIKDIMYQPEAFGDYEL